MPKKSNLLLLLILVSSNLFSQKLEVGMGVGPTYYKGDLQPNFRVFAPSLGTNAFVRYNFSKSMSIKGNGSFLSVNGDDQNSNYTFNKERNFHFKSLLSDYHGQIEYNFLNFRTHNGRYEHSWTPYLFGGMGQSKILKARYYSIVDNGELRINDKPKNSPKTILSYGIGFKKIYKGKWNFGVEFSTRFFNKARNTGENNDDILDGFGVSPNSKKIISNYNLPSYSSLTDPFRFPNSPQKDLYYHVSFSVSYLFYKVHCP